MSEAVNHEQKSPFTHVDIKKRSQVVAEQVIEAIKQGQLKPGDQLPAERELAEQTGISRPSVREAISAMQLFGIVEARPGQGTFITDYGRDIAHLSSALSDLYKSGDLREALEIRRLVEQASTQLMIERKTPALIEELQAAIDELRIAAENQDFDAYNQKNHDFHAILARSSGNELLEKLLNPLMNVMISTLGRALRKLKYDLDPEFFTSNFVTHERIFQAYKEGNVDDLKNALDGHYSQIEGTL